MDNFTLTRSLLHSLLLTCVQFPFSLSISNAHPRTGFACTENCHGRMVQEYDDLSLHTQLKCLESLFDVPRYQAKKKINDVA